MRVILMCAMMFMLSGCEAMGGLAAGINQARAANPVKTTNCVRVQDQLLCQTY